MIKGEYDKLTDIAKNNVCAEHKMPLVVAWYDKQWTLRCDANSGHYPDVVTRQLTLTEEYKAGTEIPEPIKSNIIKRQRRKAMTSGKQPIDPTRALIPQADLATGELLSEQAKVALISYAEKYHLDPYRGHVLIMTGKPYTLQSRPMTTEEIKDYKVGATDHAWLAKVSFTDTGDEFTGVGIVTYEEMTAKSPRDQTRLHSPVVAAHPWQLCQKRAEWQALRRAFSIGETKEKINPITP